MAQISISDFEPVYETLDHNTPLSSDLDYHTHNNPFASSSFIRSPISLVDVVGPEICDSDCFSGNDSDSERDMDCFITDLVEHRTSEQTNGCDGRGMVSASSVNELGIGSFDAGDDGGLALGLGYDTLGYVHEIDEFSCLQGVNDNEIRVVELDLESDSDNGVDGVVEFDSGPDNQDSNYSFDHANDTLRWDSFPLEDERPLEGDFDWEEVGGRENERENFTVVEEMSVASGFSTEEDVPPEEAVQNLEWEVLLAVNSFGRNAELQRYVDGASHLAAQDDYVYDVEYDTLFGQVIESENAFKGSPPAAKRVVENLPFVELTVEELQEDELVCAVCKDNLLLEEKVRRLPCRHYYHGDCIVPWLGIRNTCPVCRYELPTDDPDYERRKSRRSRSALSRNPEYGENVF